jgi:hypothetical protein
MKNMEEAIQIEAEGSATLNRTRCSLRLRDETERISPSSPTMSVAGAVPKRITAVKTNISDTEMVAVMLGTLIVSVPLIRVNAARISHVQEGG